MRTQNSVNRQFFFVVFIVLLTISTLTLFFIQRENDIEESHNINGLRAYTSSIVNYVNEDFPNLDEDDLALHLNDLKLKCLVADLSSNVLYNDTSFDITDITHDLYQDQSYSSSNADMIKVSFAISGDTGVVGFIVFEVPQEVLVENTYIYYHIAIVIELILLVTSLICIVIQYKKNILDPISILDKALLDISNGIYNKLHSSNGVLISCFRDYNIMLDKLETTLSNQADYAKSRKQLIANISHEIRTPLSYVKMSAEILDSDESVSAKNKKYIKTILNKITSIDGIIEDLFRYSKQDLDKLLVELKETYVKDMFDRIFSDIKQKDETKNISINISNDIPNVIINADDNRLVQVVSNMVDNAEKHIKEEGFINITTEIEENHLLLIIEDSGEGIDSKDLPYIFEPFYQGAQDDNIKKKGAGLGLAICDYIVKKHNGEIFVYTEKDKGTKFIVKFPEIK